MLLTKSELLEKGLVENRAYGACFTFCTFCKEYRWFKFLTDLRGLQGFSYCTKCEHHLHTGEMK